MFKELDKKETVEKNSIFFVCSVFWLQHQLGRRFTKEEWVRWTIILNLELKKINLHLYDWSVINQPEQVKSMTREQFEKLDPIKAPKDGPTEEVQFSPLEVALATEFYREQMRKEGKMSTWEIFHFANRMVNGDIEEVEVDGDKYVGFEEMNKAATRVYQKQIAKRMN